MSLSNRGDVFGFVPRPRRLTLFFADAIRLGQSSGWGFGGGARIGALQKDLESQVPEASARYRRPPGFRNHFQTPGE